MNAVLQEAVDHDSGGMMIFDVARRSVDCAQKKNVLIAAARNNNTSS